MLKNLHYFHYCLLYQILAKYSYITQFVTYTNIC